MEECSSSLVSEKIVAVSGSYRFSLLRDYGPTSHDRSVLLFRS